jgi:hypothetical protein
VDTAEAQRHGIGGNDPPPEARLDMEWERPWLYPAQLEALFTPKDFRGREARYAFVEASTKAGKTVGCMAWLIEQAVLGGGDGREYWWVAPVYPQAEIAWRRSKRAIPWWFVERTNRTDLTIELVNGATLRFRSAEKPDNLYGEDVYAAVLDEASRMREEAWAAVRSTLTFTRGKARIIGNVKGRKNWFYRLSRIAEHGAARMSFRKLTAYDAVAGGVLAMSEIEDAKAMLPDDVFRELYLAEPSDDGGNPFGLSHIKACARPKDWLSEGRVAAIGIDLAKKQDWTVVIGLDREGQVCGFERWQRIPWGMTVKRIKDLIGDVPCLVDATGVGDPIVDSLQETKPKVEGLVFTPKSKQMLMEGLAVAIQSREVSYPDGLIRQELDEFEYEVTRTGVRYTAPEGLHDDCVMALALAKEMHRRLFPQFGISNAVGEQVRVSPWTGASTGGQMDGHEAPETRWGFRE